jgi:hypothetical protein
MRPVISDDRIFYETQQRVDATETHTVSLDGVEVELDLTAANAQRLLEDVQVWLECGHAPGTPSGPVKLPGRRMPSTEAPKTRALHKAMRDYGDANEMGEGAGYERRPGGKTGYIYDGMLLAGFQGYLRERGHPWAEHPSFITSRKRYVRHASSS